jgi:hypothetical protein
MAVCSPFTVGFGDRLIFRDYYCKFDDLRKKSMSKENEGKTKKKETEWKPDEKIAMTIRKSEDWKPDPKLVMKLKEGLEKKEKEK